MTKKICHGVLSSLLLYYWIILRLQYDRIYIILKNRLGKVTVCHLGVRPRGRLLAEIRAAWKSRISPQMAIWPPSGKTSKSNPLSPFSTSAKGPKFHERRTYHLLRIITPRAPWLQAKHHSTNNRRTKIFLLLFLFFYFYSFLCKSQQPSSFRIDLFFKIYLIFMFRRSK